MASRQKVIKRDWGRGFATAGRSKTCTLVSKDHFGPIPGVEVGMSWQFRIQASEVGVHRPPVGGIAGGEKVGCQSIVLAGGYEDDEDFGHKFFYTGSGGRDLSGNKRCSGQSFDQELTRFNKAIAISCAAAFNDKEGAEAKDWKKGKPIRVLRSYKFAKHSKFAPAVGVRYDGIYKCVRYWPQKGKAGFIVWRYEFRRDDKDPAPWEENAKKYSCIMKEDDDAEANSKSKRSVTQKAEDETDSSQAKKNKVTHDKAYEIEADILQLIDQDTANAKKWDELKTLKLRKDKWIEAVKEEFECFACCEIIFRPVTLPCGHNSCLKCLKRGFETLKECWTCRLKLEEDYEPKENVNENCAKTLLAIFPGYELNRK